MSLVGAASTEPALPPDRRNMLKWTAALPGAAAPTREPPAPRPGSNPRSRTAGQPTGKLEKGLLSFMLPHEQFPVPELVRLGAKASAAGFRALATSDHLQPWQDNEGHSGAAWVTMGALGAQAPGSWIGTTVTCPTLRYNPAVVAEAFASLSLLYPGRIFLGVGSGEALNEEVATGHWPAWEERWDRLIEAIDIIRALWTGRPVAHKGTYYTVDAKLYDPPAQPIPLLTAANGRKSMRLAGQHGDGLVTDPITWRQYKQEWEAGARAAGKNPAEMPVLVEQYVVVGTEAEARQAAELWRFGPKAFKTYFNVPSPVRIRERAGTEVPLETVMEEWPIGTDPAPHLAKVQELFDSGATIVNIHTGQPDQEKVIDFYGRHVLPHFVP